jgi:hypothetical protein
MTRGVRPYRRLGSGMLTFTVCPEFPGKPENIACTRFGTSHGRSPDPDVAAVDE